ncbi:MAG: phage tail tape measure protein [Acidobacteriota bacterium]
MADLNVAVIITAIDKVTAPLRRMTAGLVNFEKVAARGRSLASIGQQMSVAGYFAGDAADQLTRAIERVSAPLVALEDSAAKIRSLPGVTAEVSGRFAAQARAWSRGYSDSTSSFLDTSYMMLSAGLNVEAALAATETGLRVAKGTMGDATEAGSLLATVYNNLGDKTRPVNEEMTRLGDILTRTQQQFQFANFGQLAEGMKYATAAAISARMELPQVTAVIGQLNNAGAQGSMAGTAFQATMARLTEASQDLGFAIARNAAGGVDFIGTLDNLRSRLGDLSALSSSDQLRLQKAFGGPEALKTVILLSKNMDALKTGYQAVQDSAGAAAQAQAAMEKAPTAVMQRLRNNLDDLKMSLAAAILPLVERIVPKIIALVQAFRGMVEAHPGLVKVASVLLVVAAATLSVVAPALAVGGSFITMGGMAMQAVGQLPALGAVATKALSGISVGLRAVGAAATANPIGVVIMAVALAAYLVYKYWKPIGAFFERLLPGIGATIQTLWPFLAALLGPIGLVIAGVVLIKRHWASLQPLVAAWWAYLRRAGAWAAGLFSRLVIAMGLGRVGPMLERVRPILARVGKWLGALFAFSPLSMLARNWGPALTFLGGLFIALQRVIETAWPVVEWVVASSPLATIIRNWEGIIGFFERLMNGVEAVVQRGWKIVRAIAAWSPLDLIPAEWAPLRTFFEELWASIVGVVERAVARIKGILTGPLESIRNTFGNAWGLFVEGGNAAAGLKPSPLKRMAAAGAIGTTLAAPLAAAAPGTALSPPAAFAQSQSDMKAGPLTGLFGGAPPEAAQPVPGVGGGPVVHQANTFHITVQAAPAQDPKAVADMVILEIRRRGARAAREALYDAD